jgi:hypothetical protein
VKTQFVKASFDLNCDWEGLPPVYRIYVNDELFTEREWIWIDHYLTETLQIEAPPGQYSVRVEPVGPCIANFVVKNNKIDHGHAAWRGETALEIYDES